jgi:hypothetical protein
MRGVLKPAIVLLMSVQLVGCSTTSSAAIVDQAEGATALGEAGMVMGAPSGDVAERPTVRDGAYGLYRDGLIGRGDKIALYFFAGWFPFCFRNERMVKEWYESDEEFPINTYRIEFDSPAHDTLKVRFGVTDPDTWVVVDGSGKYYRRLQGANPTQVRTFLLSDSPSS